MQPERDVGPARHAAPGPPCRSASRGKNTARPQAMTSALRAWRLEIRRERQRKGDDRRGAGRRGAGGDGDRNPEAPIMQRGERPSRRARSSASAPACRIMRKVERRPNQSASAGRPAVATESQRRRRAKAAATKDSTRAMLGSAMRRLRVKNSASSQDSAAATAHIAADAEISLREPGARPKKKRDADGDENIAEAADEAQLLIVLRDLRWQRSPCGGAGRAAARPRLRARAGVRPDRPR